MNLKPYFKKIVYGIIGSTLLISSVSAKDITIRAGEHKDYSRIVLDWKPENGFVKEENEKSGLIYFTKETNLKFLIPNFKLSRVNNISQIGNALNISYSCDCIIKHASIWEDKLVIDVINKKENTPVKVKEKSKPKSLMQDSKKSESEKIYSDDEINVQELEKSLREQLGLKDNEITVDSNKPINLTTPEDKVKNYIENNNTTEPIEEVDNNGEVIARYFPVCENITTTRPLVPYDLVELDYEESLKNMILRTQRDEPSGQAAAYRQLVLFYLSWALPEEANGAIEMIERKYPTYYTDQDEILKNIGYLLENDINRVNMNVFLGENKCVNTDMPMWRAYGYALKGNDRKSQAEAKSAIDKMNNIPTNIKHKIVLKIADNLINLKDIDLATVYLSLFIEEDETNDALIANYYYQQGRLEGLKNNFAKETLLLNKSMELGTIHEGSVKSAIELAKKKEYDRNELLTFLGMASFDWRGLPLSVDIAIAKANLFKEQKNYNQALKEIENLTQRMTDKNSTIDATILASNILNEAIQNINKPEDLGIYWEYEGFIPVGNDGDNIRLSFAETLNKIGLSTSAREIYQKIHKERGLNDKDFEIYISTFLKDGMYEEALKAMQDNKIQNNIKIAKILGNLGEYAKAAGILSNEDTLEAQILKSDYLFNAKLWDRAEESYNTILKIKDDINMSKTESENIFLKYAISKYMAGNNNITTEEKILISQSDYSNILETFIENDNETDIMRKIENSISDTENILDITNQIISENNG